VWDLVKAQWVGDAEAVDETNANLDEEPEPTDGDNEARMKTCIHSKVKRITRTCVGRAGILQGQEARTHQGADRPLPSSLLSAVQRQHPGTTLASPHSRLSL
jgi:hypothetical protein